MGGGPAGNKIALGLASQGFNVKVIDWRRNLGDKLCTGIVGRECIERYPIDPSLIYRQVNSVQVHAPASERIRFDTGTPQAMVINRVAYVASFAQRAVTAGARYILGQRVLQIVPDQQQVTVVTEESHHHARAVVMAAGFGSPLVRQVGLKTVPDFATACQATVSTATDSDEIELYLGSDVAPGFFSWLVPTGPNLALAGLLVRRNSQALLNGFVQHLRSEGKLVDVVKEPTCWGIPLRPLDRTYRDRILVVGDAAGQVKPTTGGGIYYSLLAGDIATEVLSGALAADDLSAATLSLYQERWRSLLLKEMESGYSARRLYEFLTDRQISSLVRKAAANGFRSELANSSDIQFDWHSRMIAKVMGHPVIGRTLWLMNPLLARLAYHPEFSATMGPPHHTVTNSVP